MIEIMTITAATMFATIGPIDVAAMFAALTASATPKQRQIIALKGTLIAGGILLAFALIGDHLLETLSISLAALRTAGGILLLLIAIDMVFARSSGGTSTTADETEEAAGKADISVFPLATPLIAGPGAMGSIILLMAQAQGDTRLQSLVLLSLLGVLVLTFACLLLAGRIQQLLGVTGMHVITRVMGVLLAALAVQFIFDGINQSQILA